MSSTAPKFITLNNEIMVQKDGQYQFEKDKEAVKSYFEDHVNQNTVFFHDLKEKIDYLIENDYYEEEFLNQFQFQEIKEVFQHAYAQKFRFDSFMSAFKFYNDYALKTNNKEKILERYEDRLSVMALFLAVQFAEIMPDTDTFDKAMEFIKVFINQEYQPATPTMLNSGRKRRGELVSCFLIEIDDSLNAIAKAVETSMQLSKIGGGVSLNLSKIRAKDEDIQDIQKVTKGVVGVMKLLDHSFRYADQKGQRQGSGAVYLNAFHADIHDFIDTKKISGDEDTRVKTLSIGVVIPDKMIELAREDKDMCVFYPRSVYKAYGIHMDDMNMSEMYDELVENPLVRKDVINPRQLLEKISIVRYESGYPFIMFQDNVNKVHTLNEVSPVKFSNLCSEILQASQVTEYTDYGEEDLLGLDISCNLGSINIVPMMRNKSLRQTVRTGMDALTAVAHTTNIKNAPAVAKANGLMQSVGLGLMNLHGFLAQSNIAYESEIAREYAGTLAMAVNFYSLQRSMEISKATGIKFHQFEKSTYASGEYFKKYVTKSFLPVSPRVIELFEGIELPGPEEWSSLMDDVMKHGIYHAYRLAIAPTGSISYVQSATASVMPIMERVEERTYGNSKTYYPMPGLSGSNWFFYKEAYDMDMMRVVDMVAAIQEHVDQGISFTLYLKSDTTTRHLTRTDLYAHHKGIKTIYYARTKDVTRDDCLSCSV